MSAAPPSSNRPALLRRSTWTEAQFVANALRTETTLEATSSSCRKPAEPVPLPAVYAILSISAAIKREPTCAEHSSLPLRPALPS